MSMYPLIHYLGDRVVLYSQLPALTPYVYTYSELRFRDLILENEKSILRYFLLVRLKITLYELEIKKVDLNLSEVHEICDGSETTTNRFSMDGGHVTLIS